MAVVPVMKTVIIVIYILLILFGDFAVAQGQDKRPNGTIISDATSATNANGCALLLDAARNTAEDIHKKIAENQEGKIIRLQFTFSDYVLNDEFPILSKPYMWIRLTSRLERQLVALARKDDLLSRAIGIMYTNRFYSIRVALIDEPRFCLGSQTKDERFRTMVTLLSDDFLPPEQKSGQYDSKRVFCHEQHIVDGENQKDVLAECFSKQWAESASFPVDFGLDLRWVTLLNGLLDVIGLLCILYLPLLFQYCLCERDAKRVVPYVVNLDEVYRCQLAVMLHNSETPTCTAARASKGCSETSTSRKVPLQHLQKKIRAMKIDPRAGKADLDVSLHRLHIAVDNSKLMAQRTVPVGLFRFLHSELIQCRMVAQNPLRSFCAASCLIGSWKGNFLSHRLPKCSPPKILTVVTWKLMFGLAGKIILFLILIPLPFHLCTMETFMFASLPNIIPRVYRIEEARIVIYVVYSTYLTAGLMLWIIRTRLYRERKFDDVIQDCFSDLRNISHTAILRMVLSHVLLPIEKFGIVLWWLFHITLSCCLWL